MTPGPSPIQSSLACQPGGWHARLHTCTEMYRTYYFIGMILTVITAEKTQ